MSENKQTIIVALIAQAISFIFLVTGIATKGWIKDSVAEIGLFETCWGYGTTTTCFSLDDSAPDYVKATRGLMLVGVTAVSLDLILMSIYLTLDHLKKAAGKVHTIPIIVALLAALGGATTLIGIIVYSIESDHSNTLPGKSVVSVAVSVLSSNLGYSAYLSGTGAVVLLIAGVISLASRHWEAVGPATP